MYRLLPSLYVGSTRNMGKGVFTSAAIRAKTVIEVSPVIVMSERERGLLDQTLLHDYIFEWGDDSNECCMALGYVPIYNHSYHSNCEYEMDYEAAIIRITAVRNIKKGEELFINYNGKYNNSAPVWFEDKTV